MYAQILPIVVTDDPILGVTLCLLPRFTGDSTMQGGEEKGASNIGNFLKDPPPLDVLEVECTQNHTFLKYMSYGVNF